MSQQYNLTSLKQFLQFSGDSWHLTVILTRGNCWSALRSRGHESLLWLLFLHVSHPRLWWPSQVALVINKVNRGWFI